MTAPVATLELREVCGTGADGETIRRCSASFAPGRFHVLRGPVGGGKGLLLRVLGLLQTPDSGDVVIGGRATAALDDEARAELRAQRFGFVFAAPFLLSSFSVVENVAMPLFKISHVSPEQARRRTEEMLDFVGISPSIEKDVDDLSLAAQYQVAVARGLVNEPSFLVVENADGVLAGEDLLGFAELLLRACEEFGVTIIATALAALPIARSQRLLEVDAGVIAAETESSPESPA